MPRRSMLAGFIAFSVGCVLCAGPGAAQTAPDAALSAAKELITTMRTTDQVRLMLPAIMQTLKPTIVQGRPQVERDVDALMPKLLEGMTSRVGELVDQMASVYARHFTPEEMREMAAFYRSPTGQKYLEKMPTVVQESMSLGQAFGQKLAGELKDRMNEELRKKGHHN